MQSLTDAKFDRSPRLKARATEKSRGLRKFNFAFDFFPNCVNGVMIRATTGAKQQRDDQRQQREQREKGEKHKTINQAFCALFLTKEKTGFRC